MKAQIAVHSKPSPRAPGRRNLLFVSPVVPSEVGNGLAMRAALFLSALAEDWNVHLLVVPVAGPLPPGEVWPQPLERCVEVIALEPIEDPTYQFILTMRDAAMRFAALKAYRHPSLARFVQPRAVAAVAAVLGVERFDAVHVFRLYLAPLAEPFLGRVRCSLDLDDDDARTFSRMAVLHRLDGRPADAELDEAEAIKFCSFQRRWVPLFAPVSVAGDGDARQMSVGAAPVCVPNAVRLPVAISPRAGAGAFTILFVGTLSYLPNHDAALFLAREVLPELRRRTNRQLRLVVVGPGPAPELRALAKINVVEIPGEVDDLAPLYSAAHVVVAPLRAGGGTRIKILEAFAFRRPVVATRMAVEGIAAVDGEHVLLAETAPGLASACLRLLDDPMLAERIAGGGHALVTARYDRTRVIGQIRQLLGGGSR